MLLDRNRVQVPTLRNGHRVDIAVHQINNNRPEDSILVLVHGVREVKELAYRELLSETLKQDEFLGEMVAQKFLYYPTVTREPFVHQGRIPTLIENGTLAKDLGLPQLNRAEDRIMICGSPEMLRDLKALAERYGFEEGSTSRPGEFVIERAFAGT